MEVCDQNSSYINGNGGYDCGSSYDNHSSEDKNCHEYGTIADEIIDVIDLI